MAPKLLDHSGGTHVIKCLLSLRCVCYTTKCVDIVNKRVGERGGRKATLLNVATTSVSKWSRTEMPISTHAEYTQLYSTKVRISQ